MSKSKPIITDYLLCNARGLLTTHAAGAHGGNTWTEFRVDFAKLLASFTPAERAAWNRCTTIGPKDRDEHGMFASSVEKFLKTLPPRDLNDATAQPTEETTVATATKKKPAKKPAAKKAAKSKEPKPLRTTADEQKEIDEKAAKDGVKVSKGNAKYDADQKVIDELQEEKIPQLDTLIKRILTNERAKENAKSAIEVDEAKLEPLMRQHGVDDYSAHGVQLVRMVGTPKVLRKKIKDS